MAENKTLEFAAIATDSRRNYALDWVRVGAMILVATQHAMSLLKHDDWTNFLGINAGQFGVSLFMVLSGLLSAADHRQPFQWIWRRLRRVFPAYWIAMAVSFLMTWWIGYKSFSAAQVISQMLGVGLFFFGYHLVNIASWFISLLLLCYFLAFVCRLMRRPLTAALIISAVLAVLAIVNYHALLCAHMISFFIAFAIGGGRKNDALATVALAAAGGVIALTSHLVPALSFTAASLIVVAIFLALPLRFPCIDFLSRYTYEFYLIHGLFFVGALTYLAVPIPLRLVLAIGGAYAGAIMLHLAAERLFERRPRSASARTVANTA